MRKITRLALALLLTLPIGSGAAQASDSSTVTTYRRSELAATLLAYVYPGVGHFYAGEERRGAIVLGVGSLAPVGFTWMLADAFSRLFCFNPDCGDGPPHWHAYAQGAMIATGLGTWAWSVYDAHLAVRRQRKIRNGTRTSSRQVHLVLGPVSGTAALSLGIRWAW